MIPNHRRSTSASAITTDHHCMIRGSDMVVAAHSRNSVQVKGRSAGERRRVWRCDLSNDSDPNQPAAHRAWLPHSTCGCRLGHFFPFGRWGRGYRVNEAERARLLRLERRSELVTVAIWVLISTTLLLATGEAVGVPIAFVGGGCAAFLLTTLWFSWTVARKSAVAATCRRCRC